jgi:hypothetical protein
MSFVTGWYFTFAAYAFVFAMGLIAIPTVATIATAIIAVKIFLCITIFKLKKIFEEIGMFYEYTICKTISHYGKNKNFMKLK